MFTPPKGSLFVMKGLVWKPSVGRLTGHNQFVPPLHYLWRTVHVSFGSECRVKAHEISLQKPAGPAAWRELIRGCRGRRWRRGPGWARGRGSPGRLGRADDADPQQSPTGL